jgi:hypothetical protein
MTYCSSRIRHIIQIATGVLVLVGGLSCTYVWRRAFEQPGKQEITTVGQWRISPHIVSGETKDLWKQPTEAPKSFVMSFRASCPRSTAAPQDISIDSFSVYYPSGPVDSTYVFNEVAFVSYPAVSKDSLIKRFSIIDPATHKLLWHLLAEDNRSILARLYIRLTPGEVSSQAQRGGKAALDTIIPGSSTNQTVDTTIDLFLVRRESKIAQPMSLDRY